jgi:hypothetical protein
VPVTPRQQSNLQSEALLAKVAAEQERAARPCTIKVMFELNWLGR